VSDKADLPLPDYDHLPLGTLETRLHALDEPGVTALLAHERAHGDRLPVVQLLEARLTRLSEGAQPSGGLPGDEPSVGDAPGGGSPVDPSTSGPAMNPPSQGDPTNPAQPR
jgi:hypothetical protein